MLYVSAELYRYLVRSYPRAHPDDVVDCIRDAMEVAYRATAAGGACRPIDNVDAFTTTVARRTLWRVVRRDRRFLRPDGQPPQVWQSIDGDISHRDRPAAALDARVDAETVLTAIPPMYAQVMRMHYLEGLTLEEVARRLGVSAECVRKRHERALARARQLFVPAAPAPPATAAEGPA